MRTGLVVLILALIALAFFNPTMDDFRLFARQQSEQLIRSQAGDGVLGEAIGTIGGRLAGDNIDRITERRSFVIFSTYTIDFDGPDRTENEWRFIGIAGMFFETHRPEMIR